MFFRLFFKEGQGSRDGEACFEEGAPFAGKDGECLVSGEWFLFQEAASFFLFRCLFCQGDNRKAAKAECIRGIPARAGTDGAFFHSSFGIEDFVEVCFHMYLVSALRRESFEGFQEFFSVFFGDILQAVRCLLQGAHVLEAHFHVRRDLLVLAFPDEVGNGGDVRQDFAHEEGFLARPAEALREDVLQAGGKDAPDFVFPRGRKCVDDARACVFGTCGVEGGKDEVACLGRGQGSFDGGGVAHFSHSDDVGVLP